MNLTMHTALKCFAQYLLEPKTAWRMERKDWADWRAKRELERLGLMEIYDTVPKRVYPMDPSDLLNIYNLIRERRPRTVWEFGSGLSTPMIATAMRHNAESSNDPAAGKFISFEDSEFWHEQTLKYFAPWMENCDYRVCEAYDHDYKGALCRTVKGMPLDEPPDFVYIDGPYLKEKARIISIPVEIEENAPADYFILIDGLGETTRFARRNLTRRYDYYNDPVHSHRTFRPL